MKFTELFKVFTGVWNSQQLNSSMAASRRGRIHNCELKMGLVFESDQRMEREDGLTRMEQVISECELRLGFSKERENVGGGTIAGGRGRRNQT